MSMATITVKELNDRVSEGEKIDLIDVRTPVEFREVHATMARNFPLESLDTGAVLAQHPGPNPLYVICRSGSRGRQACEKLMAAGCLRVVNVDGGTMAWDQAGFPVIRGKKTISLERQVRICAGFLALTGGLLGIFVNRYYAGLSAFVGAGLMFAGITDTCGMALMLARMPWNQVRTEAHAAPVKDRTGHAGPSCCG